ncbi:hypothetical protein C8R43DRAFT_535969 [Mycena crocata]|nr:hypothetical protein C8R43DRAFT_535969 [Mycena crocata]
MSDLGKSRHGIPDVVFEHIDKYVDSLAPQIQPLLASEIETFQKQTIDSLDEHLVSAFRSLFDKSGSSEKTSSRSLDSSPPDSYGTGSLPFADEIASLTRSFSKVADEANDDLQQIFDLTEGGHAGQARGLGHGDSFSHNAKGFISAALGAVSDHTKLGSSGGQQVALDGLLGVLSNSVKEAARNPEEKARVISPEIKEKVGALLSKQHAPIAEQFTRIALDHIKRWLRGNTSTRDLGDGLKGEISGLVTGIAGMFSHKNKSEGGARGLDGERDVPGDEAKHSGFSGVISNKMSTGLAKVHREVRLEFRSVLGAIEKHLFEMLPDQVQGPLEKILGGNPFDSSLNAGTQTSSRGFGDDIKTKVVDKIRHLVRKVQETLRQRILSVVNGGHRKFERTSWMFVQDKVELKVRKYLPDVRIRVPDDIGDEGVSVGTPKTPANMPQPSQQQGGQPQYKNPSESHHAPHYPNTNPQDPNQNPPYGENQSFLETQPPYNDHHSPGQTLPSYGQGQPPYGQNQPYH